MSVTDRVRKAQRIDRWTEILFKALAARVAERWRFVSFRGRGGGESRGVVDLLAIRKDTSRLEHETLRSGDLFDIVLVQMKGGGARMPRLSDLRRLEMVKRRYHAKEVVLFAWKTRKGCTFSKLEHGKWVPSSALEIFG